MTRRNGTLTIIPSINVDIVYSCGDRPQPKHVPFIRKSAPSWNSDTSELIFAAHRFYTKIRRVVVFEAEPLSREDAHAQNIIKKSVKTFAGCLGAELVSVGTLFADVASFTLELPGDWSPQNMTAARLEKLRRECLRGGIPFGSIVQPFRPATASSRRTYDRLVNLVVDEQLIWTDYEHQRNAAVGPMWERCAT